MIIVRFKTMESHGDDLRLAVSPGETALQAFERSLEHVDTGDRDKTEVFKLILNGYQIHPDMLENVNLVQNDAVLICPIIADGDAGGFLRQIAIVAVGLVVSAYTAGTVNPLMQGLLAAGASMAAGLLLNALIPPPATPSLGGVNAEESQMYSISGQSNQVKRLATVPKVYGTHRIFPTVAANPYVQLENDGSGELVQYLYGIYDFGLGPAVVSDLRIGDTPLQNFDDVQYTFVDPNKPETDEGIWDSNLADDFYRYKSDIEVTQVSYALNGSENVSGTPVEEYQATRLSDANERLVSNTIILNFVNPEGLVAFDSQGAKLQRSVDLLIQFRKFGTSTWRNFNDPQYVDWHNSLGNSDPQYVHNCVLYPFDPQDVDNPYSVVYEGPPTSANKRYLGGIIATEPNATWGNATVRVYGYDKGTTTIHVADDPKIVSGTKLFYQDRYLGTVQSKTLFKTISYEYFGVTVSTDYMAVTLDFYSAAIPNVFLFTTYLVTKTGFGGIEYTQEYSSPDNENYRYNRFTITSVSSGLVRISRNSQRPVYSSVTFTPKDVGQFEVRVTRKQTLGTSTDTQFDKLTWVDLSTRLNRKPIQTEKRHVFLEIRIKATNQLNGTISNLSGVVQSALEVYDGATWSRQLTNNPAWVFTDLLIGEVNKRAVTKDRLDLVGIKEWADYCDATPGTPPGADAVIFPRFESNFVLDFTTTLQEILRQVTNSAQSTLNIVDGKYSALLDIDRVTPVQVFTPRNSKDFSVTRTYTELPNALRVKFIDPSLNWEQNQVVVYDTGFDAETAVTFDDIETFACTNHEQAWRFGRYMMAQNKLRKETMTLTADFEHLVCTRGDYVQITQDVMRVGGRPARVKSVVGTTVTIDDSIEFLGGTNYGYVFRDTGDGTIYESTLTPVTPNSFTVDGTIPEVGDLIVVGEVDLIVFECIVKSIVPSDDLSAQLTLIERAVALYGFETDANFPAYDPELSSIDNPDQFPPAEIEDLEILETGWMCNGGQYDFFASLDWGYPEGSVFEFFEIYVDYGFGYNQVGQTNDTEFTYIVGDEDFLGETFNFKVLAVSATGNKLALGDVTAVSSVIADKTTPPSDISTFGSDITNEVLQLSWAKIPDCDVLNYQVRYSPDTDAQWYNTIPLEIVDANTSTVSTQARSGVYLIKAVDFNGNESTNAARVVTSIPELFNLNVIETITDSPTFPGVKDKVELITDSIVLKEEVSGDPTEVIYYDEGFYNYDSLLDLGDIFTVRLQSLIKAEGFNPGDFMSEWVTLDTVTFLTTTLVSEWDVETQYRATNALDVMSNWVTLDTVVTLDTGTGDQFTEWRPFNMGDATGRIFQFRLKLISNKDSVSPRVFDATIKADMPDRIDNYNDLVASSGSGYTLTYDPSFKGPGTSPNIQISIDNAQSGDYWSFTSKSLDGFTVRFFDKNDVGVSRTFDAMVKGYGRKSNLVI